MEPWEAAEHMKMVQMRENSLALRIFKSSIVNPCAQAT